MRANDSKSHLPYLNKTVDRYILVKVTLKIGQDKYLLPILRRKLILDL